MLEQYLSEEEIARIRVEAVDLTVSLLDIPGSIGIPFPGSASSVGDSVPAQGGNRQ